MKSFLQGMVRGEARILLSSETFSAWKEYPDSTKAEE